MKQFKKMMALVIAMVMTLAMVLPVMADDPVPTNNQTLDTTISVSGLDNGDLVKFYQVLVYDQNATTTGGWSAGTGFAYSTTNTNGLTVDDIQKILGLGDYATGGSKASQAGIDESLAARIADLAEAAAAKYPATGEGIVAASNKAEQASPEAGLYVALVTSVRKTHCITRYSSVLTIRVATLQILLQSL